MNTQWFRHDSAAQDGSFEGLGRVATVARQPETATQKSCTFGIVDNFLMALFSDL